MEKRLEGRNYQEIAEYFNLSFESVKKRFQRIQQRLKKIKSAEESENDLIQEKKGEHLI